MESETSPGDGVSEVITYVQRFTLIEMWPVGLATVGVAYLLLMRQSALAVELCSGWLLVSCPNQK